MIFRMLISWQAKQCPNSSSPGLSRRSRLGGRSALMNWDGRDKPGHDDVRGGGRNLLDGVDLLVDLLGADLLGVSRHHRIGYLLHRVAILERNALDLAGLLDRFQLPGIFRRLDLAAV